MANAKTYNELNQTSAVNASDLVAVAQSDKTELQATTVIDLANAVGELNQAGALAELSLATSIGKNLLAQRLNEKGVENITPNSTLVEMADAVDKLAIDDSLEQIRGIYEALGATDYPSYSTPTYTRIFKIPKSGDTILLMGTMLYYIPQGNYDSLDTFVAGATHTYDVSQNDASYTLDLDKGMFSISEDYTKLLVTIKTGKHMLLSISSTDGFVKIKDFDLDISNIPTSCIGFGVHNNGRHVVYASDSKQLIVRDTNTGTDYKCSYSTTSSIFSYLAKVLIKNNIIYFIGNTSLHSNSYDILLGSVPFTIDQEGVVSFGAVVANQNTGIRLYDMGQTNWIYDVGSEKAPILWWISGGAYMPYIYTPDSCYAPVTGVHTCSMSQIGAPAIYTVNIPVVGQTNVSSSQSIPSCIVDFNSGLLVDKDTNTWTLKSTGLPLSLTINKSTGELIYSSDKPYTYIVSVYAGTYDGHGGWRQVIYANPSNGVVLQGVGGTDIAGGACIGDTVHKFQFSTNKDEILFGFTRKINSDIVRYVPCISASDIQSGAYDLTTKQVEIPADSEATK